MPACSYSLTSEDFEFFYRGLEALHYTAWLAVGLECSATHPKNPPAVTPENPVSLHGRGHWHLQGVLVGAGGRDGVPSISECTSELEKIWNAMPGVLEARRAHGHTITLSHPTTAAALASKTIYGLKVYLLYYKHLQQQQQQQQPPASVWQRFQATGCEVRIWGRGEVGAWADLQQLAPAVIRAHDDKCRCQSAEPQSRSSCTLELPEHCRLLLESFQRCEALAAEIQQQLTAGKDLEGARQAVYSRCYREFQLYAGNLGWQQLVRFCLL